MPNMLIAQSGGPTVAINASLAGAVRQAMLHSDIDCIYGARNGVDGIIGERFVSLRPVFKCEGDFLSLERTPAMALGSCRHKLPARPDPVYGRIRDIFLDRGIKYFFYIGGNDSMDTVMNLSDYFLECGDQIRCVGIPKTIDNDLPETDHCPGFGSAARYVAATTAEVAADSAVYEAPSVTILEIMGRNAGWLTASSALARREGCLAPHIICFPELVFDPDAFLKRVKALTESVRNVIVAASEGIRLFDGQYAGAASDKRDVFGNVPLSGAGKYLERLVKDGLGIKARSVELNVLQRSASHLSSAADINEARRIGAEAVDMAVRGETGVMAAFRRVSDEPYLVTYEPADIHGIANREKTVPREWISEDAADVTESLLKYLRPLINDENGMGIAPFFYLENDI